MCVRVMQSLIINGSGLGLYSIIAKGLWDIWTVVGQKTQRRRWHPLQYSCLENPMNGGAWWAAVHEVAKSWTQLNDFPFTFHFHALERKWQPTPVFLPGGSQGWGAWWAAVSGVAQSRTRLKRLSSSSSRVYTSISQSPISQFIPHPW